jgi:CheY-like chemotaxis protein
VRSKVSELDALGRITQQLPAIQQQTQLPDVNARDVLDAAIQAQSRGIASSSPEFIELLRSGYATRQAQETAAREQQAATDAASAAESYEKARILQPDLVLMDINMPGITGTQAVLDFKSTPGLRDTKLAFLTSQSDPWPEVFKGGVEMAKQLGVVAFYDKAKDFETLGPKVAELLGLRLVPK